MEAGHTPAIIKNELRIHDHRETTPACELYDKPDVWKSTGNAAPTLVPVSASAAEMRFTFKSEGAVMATVFGVPPMLGFFVAFMQKVLTR